MAKHSRKTVLNSAIPSHEINALLAIGFGALVLSLLIYFSGLGGFLNTQATGSSSKFFYRGLNTGSPKSQTFNAAASNCSQNGRNTCQGGLYQSSSVGGPGNAASRLFYRGLNAVSPKSQTVKPQGSSSPKTVK